MSASGEHTNVTRLVTIPSEATHASVDQVTDWLQMEEIATVCLCVEQVQLSVIDWCCLFKSRLGRSFWDLTFADGGDEWG